LVQRFYQTEWQGISFASFAKLSCRTLPDAAFYAAFYEAFFQKYHSFADMPASWILQKNEWAAHIASCLPDSGAPHVLSVGCGLGYVESAILAQRTDINLHCTEITETPLRWVRPLLPEGRCHAGYVPECLPRGLAFDMIYCGSIDYAMPDAVWLRLLQALRARLADGGRIVILSASLLPDPPMSIAGHARRCRQLWRILRHLLGRQTVQFWGWMRTVEENVALCRKAGLSGIRYGPLGSNPHCLWITAQP
jgi:protein-L-isoaspartate O-methyltransferase